MNIPFVDLRAQYETIKEEIQNATGSDKFLCLYHRQICKRV